MRYRLSALGKKLKEIALYIHIPFCANICHYCDFAKTANWDGKISKLYFKKLNSHILFWKKWIEEKSYSISSVFIGGGTPGLFSTEYQSLFSVLKPIMANNVEITIEANPNNVNEKKLSEWQSLGVNRLSIGIQSFEKKILDFLVRDHNATDAVKSLELAGQYFDNVNVDLMYGIPGQSLDSFKRDLQLVLNYDVKHMSLYNLTFESGTPIGRSFLRGKITENDIFNENDFYKVARELLKNNAFFHEEVSNWAKADYSCKHNWSYWLMENYIGVGAGSHSFIRGDKSEIGLRYHFKKNDRVFKFLPKLNDYNLDSYLNVAQAQKESRSQKDLIYECVTTSLRTIRGVPIGMLQGYFKVKFEPNQSLKQGIRDEKIHYSKDKKYLIFDADCWFFENKWALDVLESFGV